ncbi:hypothetical protein SEVIR_5G201300v4 [Setaria viridis]|uniref:Uncharacterized protein n=2 Tax=Setaria viridis TaxID=4556 RepID=A0A4U6UFW2_SETVI|nr:hypothetical protein SEVIR_5G201300v2 [Setaria viridis]
MECDDGSEYDSGGTHELRSKRREDSPTAQVDEGIGDNDEHCSSKELEDYVDPKASKHGDECKDNSLPREGQFTNTIIQNTIRDTSATSRSNANSGDGSQTVQVDITGSQSQSVAAAKQGCNHEGHDIIDGDKEAHTDAITADISTKVDGLQNVSKECSIEGQEDTHPTPANMFKEDNDKNQGTPGHSNGEASNSCNEYYEDLTPPTPANAQGLFGACQCLSYWAHHQNSELLRRKLQIKRSLNL